MKGTLHKTDAGWMVSHSTYDTVTDKWIAGKLPLHPYDVEQIEQDSKRFDNIEARIAAYPDVEFQIEDFWETGLEEVIRVAKLIESEQTDVREDDVENKTNFILSRLVDLYIEKTGYGMDMWSKEENAVMTTIAEIVNVKAKENTYTEEDIDRLLALYTDDAPAGYIKRDYKKYLKGIKSGE